MAGAATLELELKPLKVVMPSERADFQRQAGRRVLLDLRDRLNNFLDLGAADLTAADEGFNFAGQLQATLADAVEHAATILERLVEIQREDS